MLTTIWSIVVEGKGWGVAILAGASRAFGRKQCYQDAQGLIVVEGKGWGVAILAAASRAFGRRVLPGCPRVDCRGGERLGSCHPGWCIACIWSQKALPGCPRVDCRGGERLGSCHPGCCIACIWSQTVLLGCPRAPSLSQSLLLLLSAGCQTRLSTEFQTSWCPLLLLSAEFQTRQRYPCDHQRR